MRGATAVWVPWIAAVSSTTGRSLVRVHLATSGLISLLIGAASIPWRLGVLIWRSLRTGWRVLAGASTVIIVVRLSCVVIGIGLYLSLWSTFRRCLLVSSLIDLARVVVRRVLYAILIVLILVVIILIIVIVFFSLSWSLLYWGLIRLLLELLRLGVFRMLILVGRDINLLMNGRSALKT